MQALKLYFKLSVTDSANTFALGETQRHRKQFSFSLGNIARLTHQITGFLGYVFCCHVYIF